jgi:exoribonuclease R
MSKENELMYWRFQGWENFGFFIPEDRDFYGWDFYISKKNFWLAKDWDNVEARELKTSKWKKPEAKIVKVYGRDKQENQGEFIEWIYSSWDWNFGFIDVEGREKWFFVYGKKRNGAKDWDRVKAELIDFKWEKEAIVVKVFKSEENDYVVWEFRDSDRFWFVIPDEWLNNDIFIAGHRKNWARNGDIVKVKIIKRWWKNPEGIILKIN